MTFFGLTYGRIYDDADSMNYFANTGAGASVTDSGNVFVVAQTGDLTFEGIGGDGIDFYACDTNESASVPSGSSTIRNGAFAFGVGNLTLASADIIAFQNLVGDAVYQDSDYSNAFVLAGAGSVTVFSGNNVTLTNASLVDNTFDSNGELSTVNDNPNTNLVFENVGTAASPD